MSRKKSFVKRRAMNGDVSLNITAMADIFTVLLVFLLKGYATGAVNVNPSAGLLLPEARAEVPSIEALKLEISTDGVQVEGKPVTTLKNFQVPSEELQGNGVIKSLGAALDLERKRQLLIAKSNSDVKVDSKIMVIADQRTPYSTIKSVLASAAVHGFTDFKLAVVQTD